MKLPTGTRKTIQCGRFQVTFDWQYCSEIFRNEWWWVVPVEMHKTDEENTFETAIEAAKRQGDFPYSDQMFPEQVDFWFGVIERHKETQDA
jgi:hypothetical protein